MRQRIINYQNFLDQQEYIEEIKLFLSDLSCDYPDFDQWLTKVISDVQMDFRTIITMYDEVHHKIAGISIIKDKDREKKICTLRVAEEYRNKGIGTYLIERSKETLDTSFPLITVSEHNIATFRPFLIKRGFKPMGKVKSLYHYGKYEYFFNQGYSRRNILMSIKPEFSDKIYSGEKQVEFRKRIFDDTVSKVYIYTSSPRKKVDGFFEIDKVVKGTPENIWKEFSSLGCIDKNRYLNTSLPLI